MLVLRHRCGVGVLLFDLLALSGFDFPLAKFDTSDHLGQGVKVYRSALFSLSALTTIGSSGEEALTQMNRHLAVVESVMGQLYLAV